MGSRHYLYPLSAGKTYLASIMDLYTKLIVGWKLTDLTKDALKQAYVAKNRVSHHSDRGSHYATQEYRSQLEIYGVQVSMSRKGNCYDNACIEAFHSILKRELIYCNPKFKTKQEAHEKLYRYVEFFYNRKRSKSTLGYISTARFEQQYYENLAS